MEKMFAGLPTVIYSNRLLKYKGDMHGILLLCDEELTSMCCHHPLRITFPNKFDNWQFVVGYGGDLVDLSHGKYDVMGNSLEECVALLRSWVEENVCTDFSDETSDYHAYSYFSQE